MAPLTSDPQLPAGPLAPYRFNPSEALGAPLTRCGLLLVAAAVSGCATSHRIVHHQGAYFEHCHAADYDAARTAAERSRCWTAWLNHHSDGADPDRVAHANRRLREMEAGQSPPPMPGMRPAASYITFTALSARPDEHPGAPALREPGTIREPDAGTDQQPARARAPAPLASDPCSPVCDPRRSACVEGCEGYGSGCRQACAVEHRLCVRGCY